MPVSEFHVKNYLMEENHDCYQHYTGLHAPDDISTILDGIPEDNDGDAAAKPEETPFPYCERNRDDGIPFEA